jgi:hypothetical protein
VTIEKVIIGEANVLLYESSFQTSTLHPLQYSTILDSGTTIHVFNDLSRFYNFKKAPRGHYLIAGNTEVPILGYGDVDVDITKPNGSKGILRLKNVAYCADFATNLVSFRLLRKKKYHWNNEGDNNFLARKDKTILCTMQEIHGQQVIEYIPSTRVNMAFISSRFPHRKRRITSKDPRPRSKGDAKLWHLRLGHPGPMSLHKLGLNALGVNLRGPKTTECPHCACGKIKRQISRRPPDRERDKPCSELHIDWTDLKEAYAGFVRVMFIHDVYSGRSFPYFMKTHGQEKENLRVLKDFIPFIQKRYNLKVNTIRSDGEMNRKKTKAWLRSQGITFEPSAPNTQAQNGVAERSGGVIVEKARAMRIGANLPHDLWHEIVNAAVYLRDRTPRESNGWKSSYEKFHTYISRKRKRPPLVHLKAYGCRAYALTTEAKHKKNRLMKLDPRAQVGYLVGYDSTNIYRIWIPHKGTVISTRDVIFDETTFFDGQRTDVSAKAIAEMDELIEKIKLPQPQAINEAVLEDDDEEEDFEPPVMEEDSDDDEGNEPVRDFDENEDLELAKALEEAYLTPPPTDDDEDSPCAFHVGFPAEAVNCEEQEPPVPMFQTTAEEQFKDSYREALEGRFDEFIPEKITTPLHGAFVAGTRFTRKRIHKRNLPPEPKSIEDLESHPLREQFRLAQLDHLKSHEQMKSFHETDKKYAKGQRILSSMWVFVYKTDKHGFLQKCKARLVVCGNQQPQSDLPTRATTLASMAFRTLMAVTAKFDLETIQMDAVNAFVHCDLDEVVYMKMPPGFTKQGRVLRLQKALYGLRRSPLLWQKKFTSSLAELGFKEVPQEPCVMLHGGVVVFFYIDDIVFCHRKKDEAKTKDLIKELQKEYEMNVLGELKWFLGIHVLRDRRQKKLWLSQAAYIEKIANQYQIDLTARLPDTPMAEAELLPSTQPLQKVERALVLQYQRKMGSILYAAITTRPDVSFAAARLARFSANPGREHQEAIDRVIQYLYGTRARAICYGGVNGVGGEGARSFICASDSSFADNSVDRKSSQGYIMTLFGGPIAWRANKQDTVTTSSTEAELLALSQTAKEAIFISRLFKAMTLRLHEPLVIDCDNTQTLRIIREDKAKLTTKLRHVDIHQHWLRQEYSMKRVLFEWKPTKEMIADGLTKALSRQKFGNFVRMIGLVDIGERLDAEKRMEDLKSTLMARKTSSEIEVRITH